jgi:hypothetical protein
MSSQIETGMVKLGYTTTSDQTESWSPSVVTTRDMGMKSSVGGTRYTRKIPMPARSPHPPRRRASE